MIPPEVRRTIDAIPVMSKFNREELVQTLFEESADALFLFDPSTDQLVDVNFAVQRLTNFTRQELLKLPVSYLFRSEVPGHLKLLQQAFRKTGLFHSQEGFLLRAKQDGVWIPVNLTVTRLHVHPKTMGLINARDVREHRQILTDLRRTEAELRQVLATVSASEAKYRSLAENLEQCIFLKDKDFRFVAANRPFCQVLGRSETDIVGKTDFDFYPPELAEKYRADDHRVVTEAKPVELEEQSVLRGAQRTVRVIKTPVKDADGQTIGVMGIFWDVTEQRRLEAQLRQAQKMEAIGQLAGGIAHDFNNLLHVILGNVALLKNSSADGVQLCGDNVVKQRVQLLAETDAAARQAASLTTKLLGFSRRTTLRLEPADLHACAKETEALLRRTIDPRIEVEVRTSPNLWRVRADMAQMSQILINLCLNARDAMAAGGQLTIETSNTVVDAEYTRYHMGARPGEYVRIRVEDNGTGMPPDVLQHIFEPFFTTKEPGKGTGLGLAMVFGIVQQHQGWLACESVVNRGTRMDVFLPRHVSAVEAEPRTALSPRAQQGAPCRGRETILLADDEPLIRNLGRTILESYGYTVLLAEDGQQAVEIYGQKKNGIDLVILDMTMPRLSGRDALRQLLQINPEVRVLFASGYSCEQVVDTESAHVLGFVGKPYPPAELARSVRSALDVERGPNGKPHASASRLAAV
jgi:PAS domain S-box-containing protein